MRSRVRLARLWPSPSGSSARSRKRHRWQNRSAKRFCGRNCGRPIRVARKIAKWVRKTWWRTQSKSNPSLLSNSLLTGNFSIPEPLLESDAPLVSQFGGLRAKFPIHLNREFLGRNRDFPAPNREDHFQTWRHNRAGLRSHLRVCAGAATDPALNGRWMETARAVERHHSASRYREAIAPINSVDAKPIRPARPSPVPAGEFGAVVGAVVQKRTIGCHYVFENIGGPAWTRTRNQTVMSGRL
jgi:hypothetical protein